MMRKDMFHRTIRYIILCAGLIVAAPAGADGFLGKVKEGAGKVGKGAGTVMKNVGETIESTADLVKEEGTPAEIRAEIDTMAGETLQRAFTENPDIRTLFDQSAGYAIFDARNIRACLVCPDSCSHAI